MTIAEAPTYSERIGLIKDAMRKIEILKNRQTENMKKRKFRKKFMRLKGSHASHAGKPCVAVFIRDMSIIKFNSFADALSATQVGYALFGKLAALNNEILTKGSTSEPCRRQRHNGFVVHNGAIIFRGDDYDLYENQIKAKI